MSSLKAELSESGFRELSTGLIKGARIPPKYPDTIDTPVFDWNGVKLRLEAACYKLKVDNPRKVKLNSDNTFIVPEITIFWEVLILHIEVQVPVDLCIPGGCVVWDPIFGCTVSAPDVCPFKETGTVKVALPLHEVVKASELSIKAGIHVMNQKDRFDLRLLHPVFGFDAVDFEDTVNEFWETKIRPAVKKLIEDLLPDKLAEWVTKLTDQVMDILIEALDIDDELKERLLDWFNLPNGLLALLGTIVAQIYEKKLVFASIDNPYEIMGQGSDPNENNRKTIPVKLPMQDLGITINDQAMIFSIEV